MAIGDAQRVWYPEMLADLKQYWFIGVPWEEVIAFCGKMTIARKELALSKGIKPPMYKCPKSGLRAQAAYPTISVRSLIFALQKVGAISNDELKEIDRDWKEYRRKNSLDAYGKKSEPYSKVENSVR